MSTTTAPVEQKVENAVPAAITGKFNIALTQSGFQKIQDKANSLVIDEDHIEEVGTFLKDARKIAKAIEETHKKGKEHLLREGKQWDTAKKDFLKVFDDIIAPVSNKYANVCTEISNRKRREEEERQRIANIKSGIETNAVAFASIIAGCKTAEELTAIEKKINLEKTRKEKYEELLPVAVLRFTELNKLLAAQKITVKNLEETSRQKHEALANGDDAKAIELTEKEEELTGQVEDNKVSVQEAVVNQSMENFTTGYTPTISPDVKARRTTWKFEMVDQKEVMKRNPELLVISLDDEKVKEKLKTLRETDVLKGKTELTLNGIRYYEEKSW
jgi:hypothetical protein